jgi:hypothetical protein
MTRMRPPQGGSERCKNTMSVKLNPDKALIFRIVHVDNVPWILEHGIDSRNSPNRNPDFVNIGNPDLINMRAHRQVEVGPGGSLADYVPFYFTPFSIMMLNIKTGYGGIPQRPNKDIVIFISSLHRLAKLGLPFVFTNQHAYTALAEFYTDTADLRHIDWPLLQSRDFKHDPDDPGKKERYQAEALVHRHVPLEALLGIGCHDEDVKEKLDGQIEGAGIKLRTEVTKSWYF